MQAYTIRGWAKAKADGTASTDGPGPLGDLPFTGQTLSMIFAKPSLRTRASFETVRKQQMLLSSVRAAVSNICAELQVLPLCYTASLGL